MVFTMVYSSPCYSNGGMKAYKGVVENGVVVVIGARLPEGTAVTVTVGEGELLRAAITSAIDGGSKKLGKKIKVRLRPVPGLSSEKAEAPRRQPGDIQPLELP